VVCMSCAAPSPSLGRVENDGPLVLLAREALTAPRGEAGKAESDVVSPESAATAVQLEFQADRVP